jgi:3-oxoacyl-[acyl-carrier-protein] synthase II
MDKHRVVITGIGIVSPYGLGKEVFCKSLLNGKSSVRRIQSFDSSDLNVQIAGEVLDFQVGDYFESHEVKHIPRVTAFAIVAAAQTFQDAQIDTGQFSLDEKRSVGIILGTGGGTAEFSEQQYELYRSGKHRQNSVYAIPSSTYGNISSEVSMRFGLKGLSHVISTGCTSSSDAVGYAAQQIQLGKLPMILSGGCDATITKATMTGFCLMKVLTPSWNDAPEKASRPFSKNRDGFVLGEGAWFFLLEELEHAQKRKAQIYGEILGYASTCDAYHRVRLDESGEEPARAMDLAIRDAGLAKDEIDYINLHGTSTQLNDAIETKAIKICFCKHAYKIPMSATKSLIGHPQGASGSSGLAATLLMMQDGFIHPTLNLNEPDPLCDLNYVPKSSLIKPISTALINTIGFGSKNSVLVIRKYSDKS